MVYVCSQQLYWWAIIRQESSLLNKLRYLSLPENVLLGLVQPSLEKLRSNPMAIPRYPRGPLENREGSPVI
jgi:hypothetical protein